MANITKNRSIFIC